MIKNASREKRSLPLASDPIDHTQQTPPWQRQTSLLGAGAALLAVYIAYLLRPSIAAPYVSRYVPVSATGRAKYNPILPGETYLYFLELVSGHQTLTKVSVAGGETSLVHTSLSNLQLADISPDGRQILVGTRLGTQADWPLWKISLDETTAATRLGSLVGHAGTWSPDGRQIAYGVGHELYLADSEGSQPRRLVSLPGEARWIRWSPDAAVLRFTLLLPNSRLISLWEVSSSGENLRPLLPNWNDGTSNCCGNWTQDGTYFVFQSIRSAGSHIWAIREHGSILRKNDRKPVQLTRGPISFRFPVPSFDDRKIFVFADQKRSELLRYDVASERFEPHLGGVSAEVVDFSKNNQWVAYVSYPEGVLWRSRIDGTERLRLSPESMHVYLPRWSPDGAQLAFRAEVLNQPVKIYTVSASGENLTRLFPDNRNEQIPAGRLMARS